MSAVIESKNNIIIDRKASGRCANSLTLLIEKFPLAKWDWQLITKNPNATLEYILSNPRLPWKPESYIWNPHIIREVIKQMKVKEINGKFPSKPDFWDSLPGNYIDWDVYQWPLISSTEKTKVKKTNSRLIYMKYLKDKFKSVLDKMDSGAQRKWMDDRFAELIEEEKQPWIRKAKKYNEAIEKCNDLWRSISASNFVTWEIIISYPSHVWDWDLLSSNSYVVTLQLVRDNPDKPWNYNYLFENASVINASNFDYAYSMLINSGKRFYRIDSTHIKALSSNPGIDWETVKKYRDIQWTYDIYSNGNIITRDVIEQKLDQELKCSRDSLLANKYLSDNVGIATFQFVKSTIDRYIWDFGLLCMNSSFATHEIVENNPELGLSFRYDKGWNWIGLSINRFLYDENSVIYKETRENRIKYCQLIVDMGCLPRVISSIVVDYLFLPLPEFHI